MLLLPCLLSPSGFPQIEYVNGRTQQAFVSSSYEKGGGRDLLESEAAYAYCQSISQVKSLQVPLETTQSYFVQSVLTLLSSAPAYCLLLFPVSLSLSHPQPPVAAAIRNLPRYLRFQNGLRSKKWRVPQVALMWQQTECGK